jgi:hypothetical protein
MICVMHRGALAMLHNGKLSGPFEGVALEKLSSTEVVSNVVQTMAQRASLIWYRKVLG